MVLRAWKGMTPAGMPGKFAADMPRGPRLESAALYDLNDEWCNEYLQKVFERAKAQSAVVLDTPTVYTFNGHPFIA